MAGLMQPVGNRPTPQQQPQGQGMEDPEDGTPNVSPEEQAAYDKFVGNAMEIIYPQGEGAQISPAIMSQLQGEQDDEAQQVFEQAQPPLTDSPVDNLAKTTTMLVLTVEDSAAQAGADIPDEVVFHAGREILEQLADVAEAASIYDFSEQETEGAFYRAIDLYRISSPRVDPQALSEEFSQVEQADKQGTLGQLLPGIEQRMQGAG